MRYMLCFKEWESVVQAANDTNQNVDRDAIADEIDQLIQEIDRIGNNTEFNGINLFNET